jgi:hypothetical protein
MWRKILTDALGCRWATRRMSLLAVHVGRNNRSPVGYGDEGTASFAIDAVRRLTTSYLLHGCNIANTNGPYRLSACHPWQLDDQLRC